ncbi:hypothetical protein [Limosilactobacillus antri]|uniref:hypothetical protein n=1 Tax=Limosilactobacillus antri TaxID=227943 RepID=UPI001F55B94A|nr:hypothetical protein [Limosilactobacillus antri]
MNTLQYTQTEFTQLLNSIIAELLQKIKSELVNTKEEPALGQVIQSQCQAEDLAHLVKDLTLVCSYSIEVTYYVTWQITINYKQIPSIHLTVHPITENSYYSTPLSMTLNHYLTKHLLNTGVIPNPWTIS